MYVNHHEASDIRRRPFQISEGENELAVLLRAVEARSATRTPLMCFDSGYLYHLSIFGGRKLQQRIYLNFYRSQAFKKKFPTQLP